MKSIEDIISESLAREMQSAEARAFLAGGSIASTTEQLQQEAEVLTERNRVRPGWHDTQ